MHNDLIHFKMTLSGFMKTDYEITRRKKLKIDAHSFQRSQKYRYIFLLQTTRVAHITHTYTSVLQAYSYLQSTFQFGRLIYFVSSLVHFFNA